MPVARIALLVDRRAVQRAAPFARDAVECHRDLLRMFSRAEDPALDAWEADWLRRSATNICAALSDLLTGTFEPVMAFDPAMRDALSDAGLVGDGEGMTFEAVEAGVVAQLELLCRALESSLARCSEQPSTEEDEALRAASAAVLSSEDPRGQRLSVALLRALCPRVLDGSLSKPARHLLIKLLSDVAWSPHAGIVEVLRERLPVNIDCTSEETAAAYRELWNACILRRDGDFAALIPGGITLRLLIPERESLRPDVSYREEAFGAPAAWVPGKWPQEWALDLDVPASVTKPLERWAPERIVDLRHHLQEHVGDDAYIGEVWLDEDAKPPGLTVDLWLRDGGSPHDLRAQLTPLARAWLEQRFAP